MDPPGYEHMMDVCGIGADAMWISNTSSAVIQIDPVGSYFYTFYAAFDPLRREAFETLGLPGYDAATTDIFLQPGYSVKIRTKDGRKLSATFELPLLESSQSYVALLLIDWLKSKLAPPTYQLAESFQDCVEKLAQAIRVAPTAWDAQLLTSIDVTVECGSLAKDVLEDMDIRPRVTRTAASTQLADDIARTIDDIPRRAPTLDLPYNRLSRLLGKLLQIR